jgi:hypothetical protein
VVGEVWAAKCEGMGYGRKDNMTRTLLLRLTSQPPTHSRLLLAQVVGPKNLQALWQVGTLAGWDAGMRAPRNSGTQALRQQQATQAATSHPATKPPSHNSSPQPHVSGHRRLRLFFCVNTTSTTMARQHQPHACKHGGCSPLFPSSCLA